MPPLPDAPQKQLPVVMQEFANARKQLGTLGGGNHFIEVQQGSDGRIWLMVHSGSRNLGYKVAGYYNKLAQQISSKIKNSAPAQWQLAHLETDSEPGQRYLAEMDYCVTFAQANRRQMMLLIEEIFSAVTGCTAFGAPLDVAHNYAARELHFGCEVIVHRKGATRAFDGELGIIPGSQGTTSYIVRGLGNCESFCSCSHGAGRVLGRKQAQKSLNLERERELLEKRNIVHSLRSKKDLDEAPGAYKNINKVMANQKDLVEPVVELAPLAVVKG